MFPLLSRDQRIDAIPWGELRHADGSAENLRPLVHAVFDADPETSQKALWQLSAQVCLEEYCVYDSTAAAIPFLVEAYVEATGLRSRELHAVLSDITRAVLPHVDPWRGLRGLPGADRLLRRMAPWRDDQGASPAIRTALFGALPPLLAHALVRQATEEPATLGIFIAQGLARLPGERRAACVTRLVEAYGRARGELRRRCLLALIEANALDRIAEPDDRDERWLYLAHHPARAGGLADIVLEVSMEDVVAFDVAFHGMGLFVVLGAPLIVARPELQPDVARRLVRHRVAQAAGRDSTSHWSVGPADFLIVFVGGVMPAALEPHQLDLLELAYRAAFLPKYTNSNQLEPIKAIGAPTIRARASTLLVSHGRAPLP